MVARKLQLRDFENWISLEQNGYKETPPDYRIIGGELQAWNPYQGWIPVVIQGKMSNIFNKVPMSHPIATIAEAYNGSKGSIAFSVSEELTEFLNNNTNSFQTKFRFYSTKIELKKIISAVRNRILEWSILLEENKIIGNGLTFTDTEMKAARESPVINNYTNIFHSTSENTQIQQGGNGNQQ